MAFFAKKSKLFVLTIILLISSSHANDQIPQVRKEDRKLLGFAKVVGSLVKGVSKGVDDTTKPAVKKVPTTKPVDITAKNIGESGVGKGFGTGFRVGWKRGKWYYRMEERCEKYQSLLNCIPASPACHGTSWSCFVQVAGNTRMVDYCQEECEPTLPTLTPCTYHNGVFYLGSNKLSIDVAHTKCQLDAANSVTAKGFVHFTSPSSLRTGDKLHSTTSYTIFQQLFGQKTPILSISLATITIKFLISPFSSLLLSPTFGPDCNTFSDDKTPIFRHLQQSSISDDTTSFPVIPHLLRRSRPQHHHLIDFQIALVHLMVAVMGHGGDCDDEPPHPFGGDSGVHQIDGN
ncbi:unnamed protein product [Lactuca saligna]|uniref:Uncharacterized protein n=1 Tax=Lactuca saligna TaxID=75948 RepID=A0AA35YYT9_LACSI|nr:unnamed protein product [Lactuca saligna]